MPLAPWLNPLDFVGAMHSGAALGLQRANLESQANEAAGQLQAKYAEMGAQQAMASQRVAADREQAAAQLALKRAMDEGQTQHEQDVLRQQAGLAANQLAERTQAANDLNAWRKGTLGETARHHGAMELSAAQKLLGGNANIVFHPETPGVAYLRNPSGAEVPIIRPAKGLTGESIVIDSDLKSQIRALDKQIAATPITAKTPPTIKATYDSLNAARQQLINQRKSLYNPPPPPTHMPVNMQGAQGTTTGTSAADALTSLPPSLPNFTEASDAALQGQGTIISPAAGSIFTPQDTGLPATNRIRVYNPQTGDFE